MKKLWQKLIDHLKFLKIAKLFRKTVRPQVTFLQYSVNNHLPSLNKLQQTIEYKSFQKKVEILHELVTDFLTKYDHVKCEKLRKIKAANENLKTLLQTDPSKPLAMDFHVWLNKLRKILNEDTWN